MADAARLARAQGLLKAGQFDRAAAAYAEAVAAGGPAAGDALLGLGEARAALGRWDEAAGAFEAFIKQFPDHPNRRPGLWAAAAAMNRAGRYDESDAFAKQFLLKGLDDDAAPQVLFISGENRFHLKDYAGAAERYKVLVETRADAPEAPAARVRLAWVEFFQNDFDAALLNLDRLDPRRADEDLRAEAQYLRGNCLMEKKEIRACGRGVRAVPGGPGRRPVSRRRPRCGRRWPWRGPARPPTPPAGSRPFCARPRPARWRPRSSTSWPRRCWRWAAARTTPSPTIRTSSPGSPIIAWRRTRRTASRWRT